MGIPADQALAYEQGANAFREGKSQRHNPYMGKRLFQSWNAGWERAKKDQTNEASE